MPNKREQVLELMRKKTLMQPKDVVAAGLPREYLYQMAHEGLINKVGRGLYQLPNADISEWNGYVEAQRRVPNGVFCLLSALVFHNLTTQSPHEHWVAIANNAWRPKLNYPPIRYISMSGTSLHEAIEIHRVEGADIRVYSAAKTVADCFKYRNRIGLDVAIEALKDGWQARKFTMDELWHCAQVCRVANVIRPYAESVAHN
ncbi:MAG: type IV toxin-antitoxin system AbiEi family antitoxin domain-containing protein [Pseudomonadota bacterium]